MGRGCLGTDPQLKPVPSMSSVPFPRSENLCVPAEVLMKLTYFSPWARKQTHVRVNKQLTLIWCIHQAVAHLEAAVGWPISSSLLQLSRGTRLSAFPICSWISTVCSHSAWGILTSLVCPILFILSPVNHSRMTGGRSSLFVSCTHLRNERTQPPEHRLNTANVSCYGNPTFFLCFLMTYWHLL